MFTVKAFVGDQEYTIHNPKVKALTLGSPYYQKGDNVNGQAEFTVYPTHPYYKYVQKLTTDIVFYKDGVEKFAGRVLYDDEDSAGSKKVFVEENSPISMTASRGRKFTITAQSGHICKTSLTFIIPR